MIGRQRFIVVATNRKEAIEMAWEHGGADFRSRFDKSTAQAQEMKGGALRVLCVCERYFIARLHHGPTGIN